MVTFSAAKDGNAPGEWQDGACGGVAADGSWARFLVLAGTTTAYDPVRWVDELVRSFAPPAGGSGGPGGSRLPRRAPAAMRTGCGEMQDQWAAEVRDFDSIIEERKFAEVGSFATLLGFDIYGLDGPEPYWQAVALGDTVLFHVRAARLIAVFPQMGPDDFGTLPDGVHTPPASLDRMTERLLAGGGKLQAGDFLFAATDAMAQWILRTIERDQAKVWNTLTTLAHPDVFARLVEDQRREQDSAKRMKNDDVTLMRLRMLAGQPAYLLACRSGPSPPPATTTRRCRRRPGASPCPSSRPPSSSGTAWGRRWPGAAAPWCSRPRWMAGPRRCAATSGKTPPAGTGTARWTPTWPGAT